MSEERPVIGFGRRGARVLAALLALGATVGPLAGGAAAGGQTVPVAESNSDYVAYVPTATKDGQFDHYTCEFDAAWVILKTFGYDVSLDEQLEIVGHDRNPEPYYAQTEDGVVVYGGDVTSAFSGDYTSNFLARTTGRAMEPLFEEFGLDAEPVDSREGIEDAVGDGALVWMKATVDFLPWEPVTWITPEGEEVATVLGNDHAVVVMGYDEEAVLIRDVLGPTSSNWERPYLYEVPWETFLAVWAAQAYDGLAVAPPVGGEQEPRVVEEPAVDPFDVDGGL